MALFLNSRLAPLGLCALAVLAGCGGGGGGTPEASGLPAISAVTGTPADLSHETMSNRVALDAPESVSAGMDLNESVDSLTNLLAAAPAPSAGSKHLSYAQLGQKLAQLSFSHAAKRGAALTAATQSQTSACDGGGTISATATLKSNVSLNAGDEIFATFTGCKTSVYNGEFDTVDGDLRLRVTAGNNISPFTLVGGTLSFEVLPVKVTTKSASGEYTGGAYGGFEMQVPAFGQFRIKTLAAQPKFTNQEHINGTLYTTTLSAFDISMSMVSSYSSTVSGYATVDTTRVSALSGGPTQYKWQTEQTLTIDTTSQRITNGRVLLSSAVNSSQTRISFQNCPIYTDSVQCVMVERNINGAGFTTQSSYSWRDYTALR